MSLARAVSLRGETDSCFQWLPSSSTSHLPPRKALCAGPSSGVEGSGLFLVFFCHLEQWTRRQSINRSIWRCLSPSAVRFLGIFVIRYGFFGFVALLKQIVHTASWGWDIVQWCSACQVSARSWVQFPVPVKKESPSSRPEVYGVDENSISLAYRGVRGVSGVWQIRVYVSTPQGQRTHFLPTPTKVFRVLVPFVFWTAVILGALNT